MVTRTTTGRHSAPRDDGSRSDAARPAVRSQGRHAAAKPVADVPTEKAAIDAPVRKEPASEQSATEMLTATAPVESTQVAIPPAEPTQVISSPVVARRSRSDTQVIRQGAAASAKSSASTNSTATPASAASVAAATTAATASTASTGARKTTRTTRTSRFRSRFRARSAYKPLGEGYESRTPTSVRQRKKRTKTHPGWLTAFLVIILALGLVGVGAYSGYKLVESTIDSAKEDINAVFAATNALKSAAKKQDFEKALEKAYELRDATMKLKETLYGDLFVLAEHVPKYGSDIVQARQLADIGIYALDSAAIPLLQMLVEYPLSGLVAGGGIDMPTLNVYLDAAQDYEPIITDIWDAVLSLKPFNLTQIQSKLDPLIKKAEPYYELYEEALQYIPMVWAVLGRDGNRLYLIAAQNTAEMRATGGFPGAIGLLTIRNGKVSVDNFGTPFDRLMDKGDASYAVTAVEWGVSRGQLLYPRDAGYLPDFTRAAWMWDRAFGLKNGIWVDGVISLTPAMVQYVLQVTGPITLDDGTVLDGTNATRILQHDLYWDYIARYSTRWWSADYLDALFAQAASRAFDKLMDVMNTKTAIAFAKAMLQGFEKREAFIWILDPEDQATIAPLDFSGDLKNDPKKPVLGVFFNVYLASKIGWWLDQTVTIGEGVQNEDGTITYEVECRFTNTVTDEEGILGGNYIMGEYTLGRMSPIVEFLAPMDGVITDFDCNMNYPWEITEYQGHQLIYNTLGRIYPGETLMVTFKVTVSAEAEVELTYYSQPLLTEYRES